METTSQRQPGRPPEFRKGVPHVEKRMEQGCPKWQAAPEAPLSIHHTKYGELSLLIRFLHQISFQFSIPQRGLSEHASKYRSVTSIGQDQAGRQLRQFSKKDPFRESRRGCRPPWHAPASPITHAKIFAALERVGSSTHRKRQNYMIAMKSGVRSRPTLRYLPDPAKLCHEILYSAKLIVD